jgi:hypothetical protein
MLAALPGAALIGLLERTMRHNNSVFEHYFRFWICVAAIGFPVADARKLVGVGPDSEPMPVPPGPVAPS